MKVSVIGCGYLGAVHAACMAELGHDVVGIDVDESKVAQLSRGEAPFYEPGLPELLKQNIERGRLRFTTRYSHAEDCEVHFIGVGTPQQPGSSAADLRFLHSAITSLLPYLSSTGQPSVVVGKSTVPVGTARGLEEKVRNAGALLAWNPEFLREGFAVKDTLEPDRLVYGLPSVNPEAVERVLDAVYGRILAKGIPSVRSNFETAEMIKVAANSFLATKISFINAMAEVCEVSGADIVPLSQALGLDDRIGNRYLRAGVGFGGGCLPKDIRAFQNRAQELGAGQAVTFLGEVDAINQRRRRRVVELAFEELDGEPAGKRVAILGAAFKPDSDDLRESPAMDVALQVAGLGAHVVLADPVALPRVREQHPDLETASTPERAVEGSDLTLLLTEWQEYQDLDLPARLNPRRAVIIDGRGAIDEPTWNSCGWNVVKLGRGSSLRKTNCSNEVR